MFKFRCKIRCFNEPTEWDVVLYYDPDAGLWGIDCPNEHGGQKCADCLKYHLPKLVEDHRNKLPYHLRTPE